MGAGIDEAVSREMQHDQNVLLETLHQESSQVKKGVKILDQGKNSIVIPQSHLSSPGALSSMKVYVNGIKSPLK